jgi:hypothetical protein
MQGLDSTKEKLGCIIHQIKQSIEPNLNTNKTMKKLIFLFAVSMISVLHAKTFNTAIEYNNFLVDEQKQVIAKISDVTDALISDHFNAKVVWKAQKALEKQCDKAVKNVEKADTYPGALEFKKSMLDLLKYYQKFSKTDFKEVCTIYCKDYRSDDDIKRVGEILDMFDLMEQVNLLLFEYAQADFATANNFTVAKN